MKTVAILGSTGSIGTQTLDVIRSNSDSFRVIALSCGVNMDLLEKQIEEFTPQHVSVLYQEDAKMLSEKYPGIEFCWGEDGLIQVSSLGADILVNALMGIKGLMPTLAGIKAKSQIALANKETLVAGGEIVMAEAKKAGIKIRPIDSEHSAIFQCLEAEAIKHSAGEVVGGRSLRRILLTASGGPFRGKSFEEMKEITPEKALKHPNWEMGKKITIDSATMMNKGLEIIEAMHLFNVDVDKIEVLVHPQSIVHSGVEFKDSAVLMQLGTPDMRIPISIALGYPNRLESEFETLDFFGSGSNLTFEKPDPEAFKCLAIAIECAGKGGTYPAVMNGANEVLVDAFLNKEIGFTDIPEMIREILDIFERDDNQKKTIDGIEDVLEADKWSRVKAQELIANTKDQREGDSC